MAMLEMLPSPAPGESPAIEQLWALVADASRLDAVARDGLARELAAASGIEGCLLLSTCHRVEAYGRGDPPAVVADARVAGAGLLRGRDAAHHLLRVAAGLESAVVGEDHILAQLRAAARGLWVADVARPDPVVDRLAQVALGVGRRVRRDGRPREHGLADRALGWLWPRMTGGEPGLAVPVPAVPTPRPRVLVVGAGQMGRSLAIAAVRRGADVTVATRTPRRLLDTVEVVDLAAGAALARGVAGIAVALPVPWVALAAATPGELPPLVDLSAPGAVPLAVREGLTRGFIGIDALFEGAGGPAHGGLAERTFARRAADEVAAAERGFLTWLAARPAAAAARDLTTRAAARRHHRVERALRRLPELDDRGREIVRLLAAQLEADLLHGPLAHLGTDADGSAAYAARRLFDIRPTADAGGPLTETDR